MHEVDQHAITGKPSVEQLRHHPIPGTCNVRDVGGYPADGGTTRWGVLFRSDALHRLDDDGRARFAEIGLRTVIDLREPRERKAMRDALDGLGISFQLQPVADGRIDLSREWPMDEMYRRFLDDCGDALAAAVATFARPEALPALVHCSAGKDRTGLVIALTLTAVGVPEDTVVADYELSRRYFTGPIAQEARQRLAAAGMNAKLAEDQVDCPPELMTGALAHIRDRYGSVPAYLARHGVDAATLDALRTTLVI